MALNQANLINKKRILRKPERVLPGVKRPISVTVFYRKQVEALLKYINSLTQEIIKPVLVQHEAQYTADSWIDDVRAALSQVTSRFAGLSQFATRLASNVVSQVNRINQAQIKAQFKNGLGVDIFSTEEGLQPFLQAKVQENVQLIKSIPEDFLGRINTTVYQGITQGLSSAAIAKNIQEVYEVSKRRAKFIARDQVAKINAAITQKRQEDLGIDEYIWRNADDQRVRGNPAGLYPKSKHNHWKLEGKKIRWDSPPKESGYNHPGQDYNCRCYAQPVIKI